MSKLVNFVTAFQLTAPAGGLSASNLIENAEQLADDNKRFSFKVAGEDAIVNTEIHTEDETFNQFLAGTIEYNLPLFTMLSAVDEHVILRNAVIAASGKDPLHEAEGFTTIVASTYTKIELAEQFWHFQTTFIEIEMENVDNITIAVMIYDGDESQLTYDVETNTALIIEEDLTKEQETLRDVFMLMLALSGLNHPTQTPPLTKLIEATAFATYGYGVWDLAEDEYPKEFDYVNVYDMIIHHTNAESLIYREVLKKYPDITIADITKDLSEDRHLFPVLDVWSTNEDDVEAFDEELNARTILDPDLEGEETDYFEKTYGFVISETTEINDEDLAVIEGFQTVYGVSLGIDTPLDNRFSEWKYKLLIPFIKKIALENDSTLYMETEEDMITKFIRELLI